MYAQCEEPDECATFKSRPSWRKRFYESKMQSKDSNCESKPRRRIDRRRLTRWKGPRNKTKQTKTNRFGSIIGAKSAILAPSLSCTFLSHPTAPGLSPAVPVVLSLPSVGAVRRIPNLCGA